MVQLFTTNPISDPRWREFAETHSHASIFHQPGWLEALSKTYGYDPLVITSAAADKPLRDGWVFCRIASWVTGARLVSLPFTDHCQPLFDSVDPTHFVTWLQSECDRQNLRYVELRPLSPLCTDVHQLGPSESYWLHQLDLSPSTERLFATLHRDCLQRKIRRAGREKLVCDIGASEQHLSEFFRLLVMTRKRHGLPPQPKAWFQNLLLLLSDRVRIRIARKNGAAIAAMLTLEHRSSVVYKYGCSDERSHHLGGMPFLFWNLIEAAKASGAETIDLGRSDLGQQGLITFKDRLGAAKQLLTYCRYPHVNRRQSRPNAQPVRRLVAIAPYVALRAIGRVIYRHLG